MSSTGKRILAAAAALISLATIPAPGRAAEARPDHGTWVASWASAEQYPRATGSPTDWSASGFDDHTLRQVVRVSTGGTVARIRLSNRYGTSPLHVKGATIALTRAGASVQPETIRTLRFDRRTSAIVAVGGGLTSDAVRFATHPLESVTVTLYLDRATGPATYHQGAAATSYRTTGNHSYDSTGRRFTETSPSWYYLSGIDVGGGEFAAGTVVAFGDSLTDGWGTAADTNNRYPDELAELFVTRGAPRPIANLGINGNKLLVDSPCAGESALARFRDQVLTLPRVDYAVVSIGVNDIGTAGWDERFCGANPTVTPGDLIAGLRRLVRLAHERGVAVVGATLGPFEGHAYHSWRNEQIRDEVNAWIRNGGVFDAVVDFERVLAAPDDPDALDPAYDSGDHLHPNDLGRRRMAKAVLDVLDV
jgi:lysophospholipase L1-like esterase